MDRVDDAASDAPPERPPDEHRPDLIGDGWDPVPLWDKDRLAEYLGVPPDSCYDLPIPRVRVSGGRIRWRPSDVREFVERRIEDP